MTFHPKDTTINLSFRGKNSKSNFSGDEGPGWYIYSYQNEGYDQIVPTRRITPGQAESLAMCIDDHLGLPDTTFKAVQGLNRHLKVELLEEKRRLDNWIAEQKQYIAMIEEIVDDS